MTAEGSGSATTGSNPAPPPWHLWAARAAWLLLALPAIWQVGTLCWAIAHRVAYPYDLEWMEGGMLHHAQRIADGDGIYGPPSINFIPYLYTPLYPGTIALLGNVFGISFLLGRMISVLSLIGIAAVSTAAIAGPAIRGSRAGADDRRPAWLGVTAALGLFAAGYPWTGGWYDLVRCDSFFLFLATVGIHCTVRWARAGAGADGHARTAAAAAILGLSFFAKQTGVFYVGIGGLLLLAINWRRVPTYAAVTAAIGLGGTAILQRATGGWFWTWIHDIHQAHDFNYPRFWRSIRFLLGHFPLATAAIAIGLVVVLATAIVRRRVPGPARALLVWTPVWIVSIGVGAIGYGTQWAVFNAYMPALLHGGIACGCAIVAVAACARQLLPTDLARRRAVLAAPAFVLALFPAVDLWRARWTAADYIPTGDDVAAGDELVRRIADIDGDVWVTFDPWFAHLAGKRMFTHRMGIGDVTAGKPREVVGLDAALRDHRFAAIVLDDKGPFGAIAAYYRADDALPKSARPRLYVGITTKEGTPGPLTPASIWVPAAPEKPPIGARILFDFERGTYEGWTPPTGAAWGTHPEPHALSGQNAVYRFGGRYFATSMHNGDGATGTLESQPFPVDGARITFSLAGGTDRGLRAELWIDGRPVRTAAPATASDSMIQVSWEIASLRGKTAKLVFVDDATAPGDHLDIDDVLIWNDPSSMPSGVVGRPK